MSQPTGWSVTEGHVVAWPKRESRPPSRLGGDDMQRRVHRRVGGRYSLEVASPRKAPDKD